MTTLLELLDGVHTLGAWSAGALWMPLVAWTLAALLAMVALRLRAPHPLTGYRARQALLFALPLGLALAAATDGTLPWLPAALPAVPGLAELGAVGILPDQPVPATSSAPQATPLWAELLSALTWMHALGTLTLAAAALAAWCLARLAVNAGRLAHHRRTLSVAAVPAAARTAARKAARRLDVRRSFRLARASAGTAPMTLGGIRPIVALPPDLGGERLRMALAHELMHLRRRDDYAAWAEQVVGAFFFAHPLVALLRRQVAEAREQACDAALLQQHAFSPRRYARLLYDSAVPSPAAQLPALALSKSASSLQNRLHAMRRLPPLPSDRCVLVLAASLLLCIGIGLAACSTLNATPYMASETIPDKASETALDGASAKSEAVPFAIIKEKPKIKGGLKSLYEELEYPRSAKRADIHGTVFLQFIVTKQGNTENIEVLRSPHKVLSKESIQAVKQMTFKPGKQQGEPAPVRINLPVKFQVPTSKAQAGIPDSAENRAFIRNQVVTEGT